MECLFVYAWLPVCLCMVPVCLFVMALVLLFLKWKAHFTDSTKTQHKPWSEHSFPNIYSNLFPLYPFWWALTWMDQHLQRHPTHATWPLQPQFDNQSYFEESYRRQHKSLSYELHIQCNTSTHISYESRKAQLFSLCFCILSNMHIWMTRLHWNSTGEKILTSTYQQASPSQLQYADNTYSVIILIFSSVNSLIGRPKMISTRRKSLSASMLTETVLEKLGSSPKLS